MTRSVPMRTKRPSRWESRYTGILSVPHRNSGRMGETGRRLLTSAAFPRAPVTRAGWRSHGWGIVPAYAWPATAVSAVHTGSRGTHQEEEFHQWLGVDVNDLIPA